MPPTKQPPEVANLPPELVNNPQYEVLRELGRGGMGVVYLAKNKLMDRLEVLKVVNKTLLDRPGSVERFLREIRSAAKLNHVNVVAAYSAVQSGDLLAFAMEYVEGEDLARLVQTQGPLPVVHACFYVQQAALGLQHAFEKQMVHRDIKPQNLILAREGKRHIVKVLDFGLAKVTRAKNDATGLTNSGVMLGTPDYIAPEQTLDAANADIRSDIYSLGCTLYYLLTGAPPFRGRSLYEVLEAHQSREAEPLHLVRREVPEELAAVVGKMMAKDPAQRYQTPMALMQALAAFLKGGATVERRGARDAGRELGASQSSSLAARPASLAPRPSPDLPADKAGADSKGGHSLSPERKTAPPVAADTQMASSTKSTEPRRRRKRRPPVVEPPTFVVFFGLKISSNQLIGAGIAAGVLLMGLLLLWVCGVFQAKTPEGTGTETGTGPVIDDDRIVGKWESVGTPTPVIQQFSKNGQIKTTFSGITATGTYKLNGDNLEWKSGTMNGKVKVKFLSSTEMEQSNEEGQRVKYRKIS